MFVCMCYVRCWVFLCACLYSCVFVHLCIYVRFCIRVFIFSCHLLRERARACVFGRSVLMCIFMHEVSFLCFKRILVYVLHFACVCMCVCVCVCVCDSCAWFRAFLVSVCVFLYAYACICVCVPFWSCVCVMKRVFLYVSVLCVCVYESFFLYVFVWLCFSLCLFVFQCVFVFVGWHLCECGGGLLVFFLCECKFMYIFVYMSVFNDYNFGSLFFFIRDYYENYSIFFPFFLVKIAENIMIPELTKEVQLLSWI